MAMPVPSPARWGARLQNASLDDQIIEVIRKGIEIDVDEISIRSTSSDLSEIRLDAWQVGENPQIIVQIEANGKAQFARSKTAPQDD